MNMKMVRNCVLGLLAATGLSSPALSQDTAAAAQPSASAALPDADPALWVVRDADTIVYLFGTFHMLDGKTDWFNDEVKEAFDRSQELVFEIDMPKDPMKVAEAMGPLVLRYAVDQQGRTLSSRLSAEQNKKLTEALSEIGAPAAVFDRFEPWFVTMTLAVVGAQKLGLSGEQGAEEVLRHAAEGRNLTTGSLETMESQIQMMDSMPEDLQLRELKETLDQLGGKDETLPQMLRVWNAGDVEGMERVMNEGFKDAASRQILLGNRNRAWAEWIDQRLDRPGTVFMAVGAGHLVGPDSVQAFLKQRGIASERVPQLTPAYDYPPCRSRTQDRCIQRGGR